MTRRDTLDRNGVQEASSSNLDTRTSKKSCNRKGCRAFPFMPFRAVFPAVLNACGKGILGAPLVSLFETRGALLFPFLC